VRMHADVCMSVHAKEKSVHAYICTCYHSIPTISIPSQNLTDSHILTPTPSIEFVVNARPMPKPSLVEVLSDNPHLQ